MAGHVKLFGYDLDTNQVVDPHQINKVRQFMLWIGPKKIIRSTTLPTYDDTLLLVEQCELSNDGLPNF